MNKSAFIATLLALAAIVANAQQRITIKDSLTQEPIAYTSVWFGNEAGGYTDESGTIEIPEGTGWIRLSHICYETKSISAKGIIDRTVLLVPKSVNLGEVSVRAKAPKQIKTMIAGLIKEKTQTCHRGANGFEMALFIPYDSTWTVAPYIHSILASLDYSTHWLAFTTIKTPIYATLRFDLRLPDEITGAPRDESIINGGIIIQPNQRIGKDGVRLSNPIPFPNTGVFVVLEWITTAAVSEAQNLVPALNMTLNAKESQTWNKKTFRGIDWMQEQNEPIYQDDSAREAYKGRIPSAKLGLKISK
ncbi:MAG: hypothetical protein IJ647_05100 [Prevotella sp.]|nr:hypothetical protein [Prevotella sp.]